MRKHGYSIEKIFKNPPNDYRPMPQWSLNGMLPKKRLKEQLRQFKEQGCGGLFAHARPGHMSGYLTDDWFEKWEFCAAECERLGIDYQLYDEFMCPGGTAGGNVTSSDPLVIQKELVLRKKGKGDSVSQAEVLEYVSVKNGKASKSTEKNATHELILTFRASAQGGFPPPDLCRRETADLFIQTTHDRYKEYSGHRFGKNVWLMFCDEPMLLTSKGGFPFSRYLAREFMVDHGYDIMDKLIDLCFSTKETSAVRYDFWWTVNRLFNMNFMKPLYDWCENNNLLCTGHLMEHDWPFPRLNPDTMAGLRWMQAPGEDLLGFQFEPTKLEDNNLYIMNLKELSSLVNQLECDWNMVETTGGAGYKTGMERIKPTEDITLSFGVNVIDPHLAHESLGGHSKYDWPQTLSDHSPWWKYFRGQADHVTRVNAVLSQGKEYNRILLLHPTTTGWLHYAGPTLDNVSGRKGEKKLINMKKKQTKLATKLYGDQIDYDLGDEFIIEEFGKVKGKKFVIGKRKYDAVIIPPDMETVNQNTLDLLLKFVKAGGNLISMRNAIPRVNGRVSKVPAQLLTKKSSRKITKTAELIKVLRAEFPPYITAPEGKRLPNPGWRRSVCKEGTVVFFCNPWNRVMKTDVVLKGNGVKELDTARGTIRPAVFNTDKGSVTVSLDIPPRGHSLFLVTKEKMKSAQPELRKTEPVTIREESVERVAPNILVIDYCDIEAYGYKEKDINTTIGNEENWKWQGFDGTPWGKQYRTTVVDRKPYPNSELKITYSFNISGELTQAMKKTMFLCLERPQYYTTTLNGKKIDLKKGIDWFDEDMKKFAVGNLLKKGKNIVVMEAVPFHTQCEIMPVLVIGEFNVRPAAKGYTISKPTAFKKGDFTRQGAPFYADAFRYTYSFTLKEKTSLLKVRIPDWKGQAAAVRMDGKEIGPVFHPPYEIEIPGTCKAGTHTLEIDVIGNMQNLMGPWHAVGMAGVWTWLRSPDHQPPGKEYIRIETGLYENPELVLVKRET